PCTPCALPAQLAPHSLPTRRSADLAADDRAALHDEIARLQRENERLAAQNAELERRLKAAQRETELPNEQELDRVFEFMERLMRDPEEHTSELQSRENLVCRLLLEK